MLCIREIDFCSQSVYYADILMVFKVNLVTFCVQQPQVGKECLTSIHIIALHNIVDAPELILETFGANKNEKYFEQKSICDASE